MVELDAPTSQVLLTRALNATRPYYFPTYVGLRLVAASLPSSESGYLHRLITRRLSACDEWRFHEYGMYKNSMLLDRNQIHEYRSCIAPSPITAIGEAMILSLLATEPQFSLRNHVYSYRWPRSIRSGRNYEYFASGYLQRNADIYKMLSNDEVAVVTDIRQFYPSVDTGKLFAKLCDRIGKSSSALKPYTNQILTFFEQLIQASKRGLPVGLESSHALAQLAIEDLDTEMIAKFGKRYFRYVDDIVVICHQKEANEIERSIATCIDRHGFSAHAGKTTRLRKGEWLTHLMEADVGTEDTFAQLTKDIACWLVFHPNQYLELKDKLLSNGLSIPMNRLHALSMYKPYRFFLQSWKSPSSILWKWSIKRLTKNDIIIRALKLKMAYEQALHRAQTHTTKSDEGVRRWQIQRVRRLVNTLFYLRTANEWKNFRVELSGFPELFEQQALAEALTTGIINPILPFYSRGPLAFSELWTEQNGNGARLQWPEEGLSKQELEGLIVLQLNGVSDDSDQLRQAPSEFQRLFNFCSKKTPTKRSFPDLTFYDEIESLRLSRSHEDVVNLARSRYSIDEWSTLEALTLGSADYYS